jgi:hypothetical protein
MIPGSSLVIQMLNSVLAIGLPAAAVWLAAKYTLGISKLANLQDWEKRLLVAVYGVCMTGLAHALKITIPVDFGVLSASDIQLILSTGIAYLIHGAQRSK